MFLTSGPDGTGRWIYGFYINKKGTVNDVKLLIKEDFGWDIPQQQLFFWYLPLENHLKISEIVGFEPTLDIISLISGMNTDYPLYKKEIFVN